MWRDMAYSIYMLSIRFKIDRRRRKSILATMHHAYDREKERETEGKDDNMPFLVCRTVLLIAKKKKKRTNLK